MKTILFLDDLEERRKQFLSWTRMHDHLVAVFANSYREAIQVLPNTNWDILFLDHDLCIEDQMCTHGVNNIEKTGTDVVNFIVNQENRVLPPKKVVLHTWNRPAADRMKAILQDHGIPTIWEPFGPALQMHL